MNRYRSPYEPQPTPVRVVVAKHTGAPYDAGGLRIIERTQITERTQTKRYRCPHCNGTGEIWPARTKDAKR